MITAPHLHAMVIHFPIALLMTGFLSRLIGVFSKNIFFNKSSFYLLLLGTLGVIVAYVSGSSAGDGMTDGILQEPIELHEEAGFMTLWLAVLTSIVSIAFHTLKYEKTWLKWSSFLFYTVLVISVTRTAYLGGQLVFKHGAGIELALPDFGDQPKG
ncbi:DUF2231 domain-containing protein [Flavobacterium jejuense]|uniref:DUF2231 domain-containing protein n=1 Tax=Flavobacterium jejuense TaxID=1544455 RepID=A0ABX0ISG6_9FLAO|nr:DUF2231 domain-containing protein [Flavobacterium jejuense]NHN24780.1 DUF2231 domain-containing protein [Flavobacterium jejuense]